MFEDRLKKLRLEKKLTQTELSGRLELPQRTYAGYERNEREPNSELLIKLADFFNVAIDYLMGRTDSPTNYEDTIIDAPLDVIEHLDGDNEKIYNFQRAVEQDAKNEFFGGDGQLYHNFAVTYGEESSIKKYRTLDEHGTKMVDFVLNEEYERCQAIPEDKKGEPMIEIRHSVYKASAGTGFNLGDMDDWETIYIPDTYENRKADFAITIKGDSMEPIYFDGDRVLVKAQADVDVGEVGIFIVDGDGYIKKRGSDRLISLNDKYDDIVPNGDEMFRCVGKVIGRYS